MVLHRTVIMEVAYLLQKISLLNVLIYKRVGIFSLTFYNSLQNHLQSQIGLFVSHVSSRVVKMK